MTGLRERKKQRTRDALILAAHELFIAQGYDTTTVDQIADSVDVSQRTFFRYFASKEEVALSLQQMISAHFLTAFRTRPPGEAPLDALRRTLDETWDDIGLAIEEIVPLELHTRMWQVIEVTPALISSHMRHYMAMEDALAEELAHRTGLCVESDPRPRVLVAAFSGVMRTAARHWGTHDDVSLQAARHLTNTYIDHLRPAVSEEWGTSGTTACDNHTHACPVCPEYPPQNVR